MNIFSEAVTWLNDPLNWTNPGGVFDLLLEHLWLSGAALLLALVVSWPLGIWLGTTGRGGSITVVVSNVTRAVPTMALLSLLPLTALGFGPQAVIPALALFAVPPLLATAYTGMREVDPDVRDAAHGMGFSRSGTLFKGAAAGGTATGLGFSHRGGAGRGDHDPGGTVQRRRSRRDHRRRFRVGACQGRR